MTMEKSLSEFCAESFITSGLFSHFRIFFFKFLSQSFLSVCLFVFFDT